MGRIFSRVDCWAPAWLWLPLGSAEAGHRGCLASDAFCGIPKVTTAGLAPWAGHSAPTPAHRGICFPSKHSCFGLSGMGSVRPRAEHARSQSLAKLWVCVIEFFWT